MDCHRFFESDVSYVLSFKFCRVKLIFWNIVNLDHLYEITMFLTSNSALSCSQIFTLNLKIKVEKIYLPWNSNQGRKNHKKVIRSRCVKKFSFSVTYEAHSKPNMIKLKHKTAPGIGCKNCCMASKVLALNSRPRFEFSQKLREALKLFRL